MLILINRALAGDISQGDFEVEYIDAVNLMATNSFLLGSGFDSLDDLPEGALSSLNGVLEQNATSARNFSRDIFQLGRYSEQVDPETGEVIQTAQQGAERAEARGELYENDSAGVFALGQLSVIATSQRLRWDVGPTEHCQDCLRLDKQVHTVAQWVASGWRPKSSRLACNGFNCQCEFNSTNEPERGDF